MNWDERGKDEDGLQRPLLRDSGIIVESQGKDDVTGASGGNDSLPHSPVHVICILALVALPFFEVNDDLFLSPNGVFPAVFLLFIILQTHAMFFTDSGDMYLGVSF
jgi:hypothetical protein